MSRRTPNLVVIALYFAIALAPVVAMVMKWHDHRLDGAVPPAPAPVLTFDGVRSEDYQTKLTSWFESTRGFRNWAIWADNSILLAAFRETRWGSHVAIGEHHQLYERDDINYFNRSDVPTQAQIDTLADKIARLQKRLVRDHRGAVPIFIPSKTTILRDDLPALWTRDFGPDPRPRTRAVYLALRAALEARGVTYIDGIQLLSSAPVPRDELWGPSARHMSNYAGCLCVREIIDRFAKLTGRPTVDHPCIYDPRPAKRDHNDNDLFRLLNAWGAPRDLVGREVKHSPPEIAADAPTVMWISTSFGWVMVADAEASHYFRAIHLDYYNNDVIPTNGSGPHFDPHKPETPEWRGYFPTRDLYVIELHESYVDPGHFFVEDAIDTLLSTLGP